MKTQIEIMTLNKDLVCRKYSTPNKTHKHVKWELAVFEKGETDNVINGVKYEARLGDAFLLGPPHKHAIVFRTTPHLHRDFYYSEEEVKLACEEISPGLFEKVKSGEKLIHLRLSSAAYKAIIEQGEHLEALSLMESGDEKFNIEEIKRINLTVLQFVLGVLKTQKLLKTPAYPEWLIGLIQLLYLPENFTMPVSEIVETTFYSHATVAKTFKKYFGVTLNDYVMNLRLEHAAELLKNTSDTVLRVCSLCGYDSLSYFIKQFKKKYGVTPLKYRMRRD